MLVKKRSPIVYAVFLSLLFLIIYSSMIPWGLPFYLDPDEHIFIRASLEMFSQPYFHPQWFGAPGSTFITIQAIGFGLVAFLGTLLGVFSSPQEFSQLYWTGNGDLLFIIGRSISSVFTSNGPNTNSFGHGLAAPMYLDDSKKADKCNTINASSAGILSFGVFKIPFSNSCRSDSVFLLRHSG